MSTNRKPAISRPAHPAEDLPARPAPKVGERVPPKAAAPAAAAVERDTPQPRSRTSRAAAPAPIVAPEEKFSEQFNAKLRPSTRAALDDAVAVWQYKNRSKMTLQSLIDQAILEFIDNHGLRRD